MLAEDCGFRNDDLGISLGATFFYQQCVEFVSDQRVAVAAFELRTRLARGTRRGDDIAPDRFEQFQTSRLPDLSRRYVAKVWYLPLCLDHLRTVDSQDRPLSAA